jgi:hypothetical protein
VHGTRSMIWTVCERWRHLVDRTSCHSRPPTRPSFPPRTVSLLPFMSPEYDDTCSVACIYRRWSESDILLTVRKDVPTAYAWSFPDRWPTNSRNSWLVLNIELICCSILVDKLLRFFTHVCVGDSANNTCLVAQPRVLEVTTLRLLYQLH